ncbi:MAG: pyridoxine 5'-phosphate oxidase C-terminal domain-containing protein [Bacteroidota bacterium]|nr:pyridoxine 5'-phosphate oxidase C-terminal domain-containing protein [Bacteroidota bacterium]
MPLPRFWGGYLIKPSSVEFWQGRSSRMHDRVLYERKDNEWNISKLYP